MSRPFYIIAHKVNQLSDISRAVERGANAIECDIRHDEDSGFFVSHNWPDFDAVDLNDYLQTLVAVHRVTGQPSLIIFDCKDNDPNRALPLRDLIRSGLTSRIDINVLITVASFDDRGFLARLAGDLREHEGVAIDEHDSPSQVANFFRSNGIQRQGYGNGIFVAGIDASADIAPSILEAISMKARRLGPRFVYIWTLNHKRAIRNYLRMGVDGIFVNFHGLYEAVSKLRSILDEDEFRPKLHLARWAHDPFVEPSASAYILTVETGNRTHAGTDANLTFLLTGDRGSLSTTINSKPPGLFERGQTNRVTLFGEEDIGEIQTLTVRRDTAGNAPGWWLRGVTVESPRLPRSHRFNFDVWIPRRGATRWVGHARYRLEIRTSDRFLAGTDATVTFTLRGAGFGPGAPTEITHEVDGSGRRFERGRTNSVTIEGPDIGRLLSLTVSHDGSALSDDWHLGWVRVHGPDETRRFDFNTWITEDSPITRS